MLFFCLIFSLINLVSALFLVHFEYRRNSPFALMWIALSVVYFLPVFTDFGRSVVQAHFFSVEFVLTLEIIAKAQLYALMFMISYYIFSRLTESLMAKKFERLSSSDSILSSDKLAASFYIGILLLSVLSLCAYVAIFGVAKVLSMGFTDFREALPFYLRVGLVYSQIFIVGIGVYCFIKRRFKIMLSLALYLLFLFLFVGGSRQPLIILAVTLLFAYTQTKPKGLFLYYSSLVASFFLIYVLQIFLQVRNLRGWEQKIDYILSGEFITAPLTASSEYGLRMAYYYFIDNVSTIHSFGNFDYFLRTLLSWLPSRLSLGLKPPDFEAEMFAAYMPGYTGTLHPTLFGSVLADAAWLFLPWVILLVVIINLSKALYNSLKLSYRCMYAAVLCASAIMFARGGIYGMTVFIVYSSLLFYLLNRSVRLSHE